MAERDTHRTLSKPETVSLTLPNAPSSNPKMLQGKTTKAVAQALANPIPHPTSAPFHRHLQGVLGSHATQPSRLYNRRMIVSVVTSREIHG
jgi:hypothetical protein